MKNLVIQVYEEELIIRLRREFIYGVPLSIALLSYPMCIGNCHSMSIRLTRGMDYFKRVSGDIKPLFDEESPNHSWVEKDGFVYEVTNCMRWQKELYYERYQPKIIKVCDESNIIYNPDYIELEKSDYIDKAEINWDNVELLLEAIELIEREMPTCNKERLFDEIALFRKNNNLYPKFYERYVRQMSKRIFPDYYNSIRK